MTNQVIRQNFNINYQFDIFFTRSLFETTNLTLRNVIEKQAEGPEKVIVLIDENILKLHATLRKEVIEYSKHHRDVINLCQEPILMPGGESTKSNLKLIDKVYDSINNNGFCPHSYIVVVGGGALLDMAEFASATAHHGIRLIRVPTTALAQASSGVWIKNAINYYGKKNYIDTFAPPYAILNDFNFLNFLSQPAWLSGLAEACRIALIKDADFFNYIKANIKQLKHAKDISIMENIIYQSALLYGHHLSAHRPFDFGYWAAHKLEQLTEYQLSHGESLAVGIALDSTYSYLAGFLLESDWKNILDTLHALGFTLFLPELEQGVDTPDDRNSLFKGLIEFREHSGGQLCITIPEKIGKGIDIRDIDYDIYKKAIAMIKASYSE